MPRRAARRDRGAEARAAASAAAAAWRAHGKLCWQCHAAGGRPGLFCDQGFTLAQTLTRARLAAARAGQCPGPQQGTLP